MRKESDKQRQEDEAIIERLRDEIETLKFDAEKAKELNRETLRNISEADKDKDEKNENIIRLP